ncbi:MAG: L-threonylcarbamoyladenylate synthase [Candidatus Dormibacteraeota bacterium]|nr:L-threonylcarbamoyladenylate synthase [Candidatus Dormibacteraeota bacterium]
MLKPDQAGLARAAELLRQGQVIGFPTDTVYGLAALAGDDTAVRRVYAVKGRSLSQPLILMPPPGSELVRWAQVDQRAAGYLERWWPGPLTVILPAAPRLKPPLVSAQPRTVGVRVPNHPVALALLRAVGEPLATTSANRSGLPPALVPLDAAWLGGLAAVLDGGLVPGGLPSTLLDLSSEPPRILREGPITAAELGL